MFLLVSIHQVFSSFRYFPPLSFSFMGKIFSFSKYAPPFPSTPWAKYSPSLNILLLLLLLSSNIFLRQFCFHGSDEEKTPRCIDERKLWLQISIPATAFHRLPSWVRPSPHQPSLQDGSQERWQERQGGALQREEGGRGRLQRDCGSPRIPTE